MPYLSRWIPAVVALCLTAACSDRQTVTAPAVPTSISADVTDLATCGEPLQAVTAAINATPFTFKNGDAEKASLLVKVTEAEVKLREGKIADALAKLEDIRVKVTALSTEDAKGKTKLDPESASLILVAVAAAYECIRPLEESTGA